MLLAWPHSSPRGNPDGGLCAQSLLALFLKAVDEKMELQERYGLEEGSLVLGAKHSHSPICFCTEASLGTMDGSEHLFASMVSPWSVGVLGS